MSDASTTFVIGVDASKGKSALADFTKSVERVGDSINKLGASSSGFQRLGQQVRAAASGFDALKSVVGIGSAAKEISALSKSLSGLSVNSRATAGLTQLAHALGQLSRVSLPRGLGQNLHSLSQALSAFHVPDMGTINRLPAMFRQLAAVSNTQISGQLGANLRWLGDGLRSIGSVPVNNLARLPQALAAVNRLTIDPDKAKALAGIGEGLKSFGSFRAPSSTAIANLGRLISTLQSADPNKLRAVGTSLHAITLPAVNIRNLSGGGGSMVPTPHAPVSGASTINTTSITNASAGLNHLQQSFSAVHAAAAAFAGYLGGLSLSSFTHSVLEAGNALTSFKISTDTLASSSGEAGDALKFVEALADRSGSRLDTLITGYQRLGGAMRSLGMPVKDVQTTFEGFTSALQAQHIPASEQAIVMREIAEVASMGAAHARQIQSISVHLPDFRGVLQQVTNKKDVEFKKQFEDGGFSVEDIIKSAEVLKTRYAGALAEARTHSQAQLNLMGNDWTRFKQAIFDGGFDAGLAGMIGSIRDKLGEGKIGDIAKGLGDAFKSVFATLGAAGAVASNHIEGFTRLGVAIAGVTAASIGMTAIGFIAAPLAAAASAASRLGLALLTLEAPIAIPLLAAGGALAVLVASSDSADDAIGKLSRTWDALKAGMGDFAAGISPIVSATFKQMEADGRDMVDVILNLGSYAKAAMVWGRKGETRTVSEIAAAYKAETATKLEAAGKSSAQEIAPPKTESFESKITSLSKKMADAFGGLGGGLLKEFRTEQEKAHAAIAKTSTELQHHGDYAANAAVAAERLRHQTEDLSTEQGKLFERLNPANAALKEYRKTIESINAMAGKKDADGHVVGADRIAAMTRQAQLEALPKANPAADEIRKLTDQVELKSKFAGDKDAIETESKVLELRNKMLAAGVELTEKQAASYRALLSASKDLDKGGSNAFAQWANNVKSDSEMMTDAVKSGLDDISSKISELVVNGKGKYKSLGDAIKATMASIIGDISKKLIKNGIDALMRDGIKSLSGMFGDGNKGILSAIAGGKSVVGDALSGMAEKTIAAATATVNAATVTLNAAGIPGLGAGTSGLTGFNTNGTANTTGLGGVLPQSNAAASAITNPPLGNISAGSIGAFGSQSPASLFANGGTDKLAAVIGAVKAGTINVPNVSLAIGKAGQPLGNVTPGLSGFGALTPLTQARNVGIGNIGGMSGGAGFAGQAPASMLVDRTRALQAESTMARAGVQPTGVSRAFVAGDNSPAAVEAYIRQSAVARGINPDIAARGFKQESQFRYDAKNINAREASFGPTQLNMKGGLGQEALKAGVNPRDPSQWRGQVDWSMDHAKTHGWGAWYGFRDSGITNKWEGIPRNGQRAALDMNPTGSIAKQSQSASQEFKKVGDDLSKSLSQSVKQTTPEITQDLQKAFKGGGGIESELGGFASKIQETGSAATSAEGGLGGLIGKLGQLGGGGGGMFGGGGFGEIAAGMFSEGGYSDSPVSTASLPTSFWHGAPHFAEGGISDGGIPSILHPNEAVVNLTRGRKIPVELRGQDERKGSGDMHVTNLNMNLTTKDQDSFRRNSAQMMTQLQNMLGRAAARNS